MGVVFITHDMGVVAEVADRVLVMYRGDKVEEGPSASVFATPQHAYTKALLSAVPIPDPTQQKDRVILEGDIPSNIDLPAGCPFAARCARCMPVCLERMPETKEMEASHFVACHLY